MIQVFGVALALVFVFLAFESANEIRDINQNHMNVIDSYRACIEDPSRCREISNIQVYSRKSHHILDTSINHIFSYLLFAFLILLALERIRKSNNGLKNDTQEG